MDGLVSIFPLNPTVLVLYSSFESLHLQTANAPLIWHLI
jgi:hypothetical protein